MDFEHICRTCMKCKDNMRSLFEPMNSTVYSNMLLSEALTKCVPVEVSLVDGLPQGLCDECADFLQIAYAFRDISIKSDEALRKIVQSVKVKNTEHAENEEAFHLKTELCEVPYKVELDIDNYDGCDFNDAFESNIQEGRVYECNKCKEKYENEKQFLKHLASHEDQYICSLCSKTLHTKKSLEKHIRNHYKNFNSFTSNELENYNVDSSLIDENIQTVIKEEQGSKGVNQLTCLECGLSFKRKNSFTNHMRKHDKIKEKGDSFKCDICNKVFSVMTLLRRHMKLHDIDKQFKCKHCPKSYSRHDQLSIHENKHDGEKRNVCPYCSKAFSQLCNLKDHIRTHTGETPYLCSQCGKGFNNSSNLRQHILRHTGLKPFACNLCPKTFSTKGQMTCHMSTHTGARPYTCDECGVSLTKPNSLKKHKLIHLGVKPFQCDACPMRFTSKDHLKRHYRIHTGEKPYKCKFCERAFTQSNDLAKHLRSHIGQNIYQCTVCDMRFRLLTELKKHYPTHYVNGDSKDIEKCTADQKESIIIPADETKPEISITFDRNLIRSVSDLPASITIGVSNDKN